MKARLVMGTVIMATSMMLSGCGSDKPEDVATSFAEKLSEANLKKVKSISTEDVQKKIKNLNNICHKGNITKLADEVIDVINTVYKKAEDVKYEAKVKEMGEKFMNKSKAMKKQSKPEMKAMQQELITKYGSLKNVPKEVKKELMNSKLKPIIEELFAPLLDDAFEIFEVKVDNDDKIKAVLVEYAYQMMTGGGNIKRVNINIINESAKLIVLKGDDPIKAECVAKYTDFGFVKSINVIETITKSPDQAEVRLELIAKDDKSKKVSVNVEKIKDEWKVSDLTLNYDFW